MCALTSLSPSAHAEQCSTVAKHNVSPALEQAQGETRLLFLKSRLPRAKSRAKLWFWGWEGTYLGLSAAQLALIPIWHDQEQQRTLWVNTGTTLLGAALLAGASPSVLGLERRLRKRLAVEGTGTCLELALLEQEFVSASNTEKFGVSWLAHGANLAVNAGAGLVLGLAWGYWDTAWITTTVGALVGEVMLWTQPMDMTRALDDYRVGNFTQKRTSASLSFSPMVLPAGAGLSLNIHTY